jgi:hypothetical protein
MTRREMIVGFSLGLVVGFAVAVGCLNDRLMPRASAQAAPAEIPRFQLRTWAYPGFSGPNLSGQPSHGAYVLDTVTGKLWLSHEGQPLKPAGQVK